jgi:hypothetical protein
MERWCSVSQMVAALSVGVLSADPWFPGWTTPEGFADVLDDFALQLNREADDNGLFEVESSGSILSEFVHRHAQCQAWNRIGSPPDLVFTSRYSAPHKERQFIDLDAIVLNARAYLRREDELIESIDRSVAANHPEFPISVLEP